MCGGMGPFVLTRTTGSRCLWLIILLAIDFIVFQPIQPSQSPACQKPDRITLDLINVRQRFALGNLA
jgi:hypothetical protein